MAEKKRAQRVTHDDLHALLVAVREHVRERENPAPDMTMRRITYDRMVEALEAYDARKYR